MTASKADSHDWKENISFILVNTLEPGNIGASARALKNLGFSMLELVNPAKFPSDEAGWFAHGAEDVLSGVKIFPELGPAIKEKSVIIGTTRRAGKKRGMVFSVKEAAEKIRQLSANNRVAVLFGREDRGLTTNETAECSFMVRIPAAPENPSFNLAQAVLIIAYELSSGQYSVIPRAEIISKEELSHLFKRLQNIMDMAGYVPKGIRDNKAEIMADLNRLIARTALTEREARMLHGIFSQIEVSLMKKLNNNLKAVTYD